MPDLYNTVGKITVREAWNTPVLKYLNQKYNFKFRYLGLPGEDLHDVKLWKDWIEEVIAFELPGDLVPSDPEGRKKIEKLRRNMLIQQIPGRVYFGAMEDVILLGQDYDGEKYSHKKLITLCNLDFCDEISSPVQTSQKGKQVLRFQAISHIISEQYHIYKQDHEHNYFMLLLTIRNQMKSDRLRQYLSSGLLAESNSFLENCGGLTNIPATQLCIGTATWALKTFIYDFLKKDFYGNRISSLFFPTVKYLGNPINKGSTNEISSPMLHCMILCRFNDNELGPVPASYPDDYLTRVSLIHADESKQLVWQPDLGEPTREKINEPPDSLMWLQKYEKYLLSGVN